MTTKNDILYKILFAIELALIPLVIFANIFLPNYGLSLFIAGILLVKIWIELFKDRLSFSHAIIDAIGSVAVFTTLISLLIYNDKVNIGFGITVIVLIWVYYIINLSMHKKSMPELIDAVEFSYMLFECFALVAFALAPYFTTITNISLIAIILTTAVSILYRIYFLFKYTSAGNVFRKRK